MQVGRVSPLLVANYSSSFSSPVCLHSSSNLTKAPHSGQNKYSSSSLGSGVDLVLIPSSVKSVSAIGSVGTPNSL